MKIDTRRTTSAVRPFKLAILNSHPIQYFAPLYRRLAQEPDINLTVYYCSRQGLDGYADAGFGRIVRWDVPLLDGYRSVFLPNWRGSHKVGGFWSLVNPAIVRELQRGVYDALWVHGHNYFTYMLAYLTARLNGIRILTRGETHLLLQRSVFKKLLRRPLMSFFYSQCDACLAIGSRNAEFYRLHGVPDEKIFLVPYAVDNVRFMRMADQYRTQRVEIKAELGLSADRPVILYTSKLTAGKRPLDVLKAKARLAAEGIECDMVMIGSGEMEQSLRAYCDEQRLRDVHFLGFRNQTELPRYYAVADVFVLPSENEPWGLVINEVMCANVPVVACEEIGSVADLVRPGENGYLYSAGDVAALADCLRRILTDPEKVTRFGHASRAIIEAWSYEQCVEGVRAALTVTCRSHRGIA